MNRSLTGMVAIALLLSAFGPAFGQGYYGYGAPMQGVPQEGYGQGYSMPGYGQAVPEYPPGYQNPAAGYGSSPYQAPQMGASPYGSPYQGAYPQGGQPNQPTAQPQYAAPGQYQQAAPGNPYTEYPQAAGQPGPEAALPEGMSYYQPGALIQDEIYWDPNYDRAGNGNEAPVVEPQPQAPQRPVATQARAVPSERSVRRNQGPKRGQAVTNRKQAKRAPANSDKAEKSSLQWGKGVQSKPSTEHTAFRWGQGTGSQARDEAPKEQVRHRAPQTDAQSQTPGRLPWGSN